MSVCFTAVAKRAACTFFKSSLFLATPLSPSLLDPSPPHEPVFGANQLCGVLDETALPDVATCLLLAVPINEHDARSRSPHCGRLSSTSGVVSRRQSNSFTRVAPSHPRRSIAARTSCAGTDVKTSSRNTCPGDARNRGAALLTARPAGRVCESTKRMKEKAPTLYGSLFAYISAAPIVPK